MTRTDYPFGFRVVGPVTETRRLVDAAAAFAAHCAADPRSEPHAESYLSAFRYDAAFELHLSQRGTSKGFAGACWSPHLWFDVDRDDLEVAIADTRRLAGYVLFQYPEFDEDDLLVFFSGRRGFHLGLPLTHAPSPSAMFNAVCRGLATRLADQVGVTIDTEIYDKVRLFRAPNSRHAKTGLHKRRVSFDELMKLSASRVVELAAEPLAFDPPAVTTRSGPLASDWAEVESAAREGKAARVAHKTTAGFGLQRDTMAFIREGAPEGTRNPRLFRAAGDLRGHGAPAELVHHLLTESALDSGLPPSEVARTIDGGIANTDAKAGEWLMTTAFTTAAEVFAEWKQTLLDGTPPTLYPVAALDNPLSRIEFGPGLVTLFGAARGAGKTALIMQLVVDALRLTPTLRALVANVEMPAAALLDRQFARFSGIDLRTIRYRKLTPDHADRVEVGMATLAGVVPRLTFARPPFTLANVARSADTVAADLVVLDYVQRIAPPGEHAHRKAAVDAAMEYARGFADRGVAVVVVSAVGRQRDDRGRSGYDGLNLASFRESSELEYGADDAYLLTRDDPDDAGAITLHHAKSRYGETQDIPLRFTGAVQRFDPAEKSGGKLVGAVKDVWGRRAADTEEGGW